MNDLLRFITDQFAHGGAFVEAELCKSGHINDTYMVRCARGSNAVRYIVQRINHGVFRHPENLMENIGRVTKHVRARLERHGAADVDRRVLTLVPRRDSDGVVHVARGSGDETETYLYHDERGGFWRMYLYIEHSVAYDVARNAEHVYQAAKAFGRFLRDVQDLPAPRLHDTIPDFHNTPQRFAQLEDALQRDPRNRAAAAAKEIVFALQRKQITPVLVDLLASGELSERTTHNDTKINNVMMDDTSGEGVCVIDLDTVMPGLVLYDFGDCVRSTCSRAAEDERDLAKVQLDCAYFEAIARGFLEEIRPLMSRVEIDLLPFSARLITFEIGIRFLADYLNGDVYFKTDAPDHNLVRARTQFKLVELIELHEKALLDIVARYT